MPKSLFRAFLFFFFLMIRRPPRSTLFPYRRSSDLARSRWPSSRGWPGAGGGWAGAATPRDRKSTRLNSNHTVISYAVFCFKKKENTFELQSHSDLVCRLLLEKQTLNSI